MKYALKIEKLREIIASSGIDGFIVPRTDEYQGEYVAAQSERLEWLTGFTGSAGLSVVLSDKAVVMSDGRYTIQLTQEVDSTIFELENSQETTVEEWIVSNTSKDAVIGYDPKLFTPSQIDKLIKADVRIKAIEQNPIDSVWDDQPTPPRGKINLFPEKYAGQSALDKIKNLQAQLKEEGAQAVILTLSDSIAWLLNIRGSDIPFIPVALSYAIVPVQGAVQWFVHTDKVTDAVRHALGDIVAFQDEDQLDAALENLDGKIWLDTKRSSIWFQNKLTDVLEKDDPCILPRACKNEVEQKAMKQAHIRDGVALMKFLKWFESSNANLDELAVEKQLENFRAEAKEFKEPSFSTISGFGANGAIVHYRANEKTNKKIEQDNLLLLDSGAQYEDGTTDITRTLAVGEPSVEMRINNTLVLKGHIALASAVFKKGTTGAELDKLARQFLVEKGLNYSHGTGHGVGCYLSVHEEAASISPRGEQAVKAGMIISNEPGYYKEGAYGIRIENLVLTRENKNGDLYFETITLAPLDKKLIVVDMLSVNEIKWLDDYHARVYDTLSSLLDEDTSSWLQAATSKM